MGAMNNDVKCGRKARPRSKFFARVAYNLFYGYFHFEFAIGNQAQGRNINYTSYFSLAQ